MIGTVRAGRHLGRGRVLAAEAALTGGLAGGSIAVSTALALAGAAISPARSSLVAAAAACLVAAAADGAGVRVRPTRRSQVPERWRRDLPLPMATFLYGTLLGAGVAGTVPAFAAWALLLLSLALGNVPLALAVGGATAAGRSLPVLAAIAVGPLEDRLTERPGSLRAVRALGAVALTFGAAAVVAGPAAARGVAVPHATDPSAVGDELAWEDPAVGGFLLRGRSRRRLPGDDPAIGGRLVAWHEGKVVTVAHRDSLAALFQEPVVGVRELAVSDRWLVLRQLGPGSRQRIIAQSTVDTSVRKVVATVNRPTTVGRPAIAGSTVVFAGADRASTWITAVDLRSGRSRRVRESTAGQLVGPSILGTSLLYVDVSRCSQVLRLGPLAGRSGRPLLTFPPLAGADRGHERGHTSEGAFTPCGRRVAAAPSMLWTTALTPALAYVTALRIRRVGPPSPSLLRVPRTVR